MKIIVNAIEVEIAFDYHQEVWFLNEGNPMRGTINGVVVLAKPKSGSHNNRYLVLFSVYTSSGARILPYGKIARTADEAYHAVKAQLMFVSHDGAISSRSTGDWLIHDFVKMTGEFLTEFDSANH